MELPFFYIEQFEETESEIVLNEDTSKYVVRVLRMKSGESLHLTDGKGNLLLCTIIHDHSKHCRVKVESKTFTQAVLHRVSISISLLKNTNRFEWFLEKATEMGVAEIIPLLCARTEKEKFRMDRMKGICVSAMLQSRQVWLPVLREPLDFEEAVSASSADKKFIAYCGEEMEKKGLASFQPFGDVSVYIGPEGDFTEREVQLAKQHNFIPVSLGETRLRTETAGLVAAVTCCIKSR